jgi:sec-independent protein translocase protein TatB
MFDIAPTELLLVAVVALVVIGPKDLPRAMRFVGQWIGRARGVARHFRSGIDEMIRQSELEDMEKKWAAENQRIMSEHPAQTLPSYADEHEMLPLGGPPTMIDTNGPEKEPATNVSPPAAPAAEPGPPAKS